MIRDLGYALRSLRKSPGFAVVAILTLALGIGANTALFSVVNGVLLNPLPYPRSSELVTVYARTPGVDRGPIVYLNFLDWQRRTRTFASLAAYRNQDYNLTGRAETERLTGYMISAGFFSTLGVAPALGRDFRPEDDRPGAAPVVLIGGSFWSREFGASSGVIGRSLILSGASYTIVGVVPASFTFYGHDRDVYTPIGQWTDPSFLDRRISVSAHSLGRLARGVSLPQAKADMDSVASHLADEFPVANCNTGITLVSMKEDMVGNVQPFLLVLLAAVGFLLLIACANVANLLLARSLARSREFAVRLALGAGRVEILRPLLVESLVLGVLGGALGLVLASFATTAALKSIAATLPRADEVGIDPRVLVFTAAVSLLAALIFGLSPALKGSRVDLQEVLKSGGRGSSGTRHRLQGAFVAVEVAMSVILLTGAGLMVRSLSALWRVNPGFNPSHAITFNLSLPGTPSTTSAETRARLRRFDDAMRAIPGVEAVSVTLGSRPMIHDSSLPFFVIGRTRPANDNELPQSMFYLVEGGFQQAMGVTLERGRFVTAQDNETAPTVIDIDDVFARTCFPNEDAVGKRVHLLQFNVDAEIVGVVGHIKQWGLGADEKAAIQAQFFFPFMQTPERLMPMISGGVAVVLRTAADPAAVMPQVRRAVQSLDRRELIYAVETMDSVLGRSVAPRRLSMILLAAFAGLALVLSSIGIYGVVSYLIGQRTQEIGVRMALGAQRADVMRLVLGHGARMAVVGVGFGLAGALALTRLIAGQLYGVTPHDPLTLAGVAAVLTAVTLLACYLPARSATKIDPAIALRNE